MCVCVCVCVCIYIYIYIHPSESRTQFIDMDFRGHSGSKDAAPDGPTLDMFLSV